MNALLGAVASTLYCTCHRKNVESCMKEKRAARKRSYELDMDYLTESIRKVMKICGIPAWKAVASTDAIARTFTYYDEIRYRIDRVPRKRLCKEDLIHDLSVNAKMDRLEAQITYSIVKRAFKAYYYGSSVHGRKIQATIESMRHRSECLWRHAAIRTAQVLAAYKGYMHSEQKHFEELIMCVYKALHDALKANEMFDDRMVCTCTVPPEPTPALKTSSKFDPNKADSAAVTSATTATVSTDKPEHKPSTVVLEVVYKSSQAHLSINSSKMVMVQEVAVYTQYYNTSLDKDNVVSTNGILCPVKDSTEEEIEEEEEMLEEQEPSDNHCNCPHLKCNEGLELVAPEITAECSQGPYICRWLPLSEEDEPEVPCKPEPLVCRPCKAWGEESTPCDSECSCICEWCECEAFDWNVEEEEQRRYKQSDKDIEDYDTDFTYVAPLRDRATSETLQVEEEFEEEMLEEDELFKCKCICKYKTGIPDPEDFNYVAPLKSIHSDDTTPEAEEEEAEEEEQDEAPKVPKKPILIIEIPGTPPAPTPPEPVTPPHGISWQTKECWTKQPTESSISLISDEPSEPMPSSSGWCKPRIKLLAASKAPSKKIPATSSSDLVQINVTNVTSHGPSKAAAPKSRYDEVAASAPRIPPPPIPVASAPAKSAPAPAKPTPAPKRPVANQPAITPAARRVSLPAATNQTKPNNSAPTAKPVNPPKPAAPAPKPTQPNQRRASAEQPLTKDDILDIIGLK